MTNRPRRLAAFTVADALTPFAAGDAVTASPAARTIMGRILPFGSIGATNQGRFRFAAGTVALPDDPKWVKLLTEHDQRLSVGFAAHLETRPDGIYAVFSVPPGEAGDRALYEAAHGLRDAFSVGVELDDATLLRARRNPNTVTEAAGVLREVSLVSVPAFVGARVGSVAASADPTVFVAAWSDAPTVGKETVMPCATCGTNHAPGTPCTVQASAAVTTAPAPAAQAAAPVATFGAADVQRMISEALAAQATNPGPVTVQAAAAPVAQVTDAPIYTFDGRGPSFVRDAYKARVDGDHDAADRVRKFAADMADQGATSRLMLAAVETRTSAPEIIDAEAYRGDQLVRLIDQARPLFSRLSAVKLTDATPFKIPVEGEFDGVATHTEGTAHVTEGTLTLGNRTVSPVAKSGAYRVSRELVDASNPAIDRIAINAMIRDYRRESEAAVVAALEAVDAVATLSINTVTELRAQALAFMALEDVPADFIAMGTGMYTTMVGEEAADGRPTLPRLGIGNAVGSIGAGYQGADLDGAALVLAGQVDTTDAWLIRKDSVLVGESNILTFRFDQPEGPGIIKLALWAYVVAAITRTGGVLRLTTAAS